MCENSKNSVRLTVEPITAQNYQKNKRKTCKTKIQKTRSVYNRFTLNLNQQKNNYKEYNLRRSDPAGNGGKLPFSMKYTRHLEIQEELLRFMSGKKTPAGSKY